MKTFTATPCAVVLAVAAMALTFTPGALAMRRPTAQPTPPASEVVDPAIEAAKAKEEATPSSDARRAQVTVLGYHRFVEKVRRPDTEITPTDFDAQMKALQDAGITVISMDDFLAWKKGEKEIPLKSALITLDDGWKSQYDAAWPILKKYGYPFTMFIYTDYVRGGKRAGGESMSWEQLAELRDAGVNIEGHTTSHQDLRGKKGLRDTPQYAEFLHRELSDSKEMIENKLGVKVRALALPYGFYNQKVQEAAKQAGYEAVFTVYGQKVHFGTPMDAIGRTLIEANKPKVFASALHFGDGGGGSSAPVAELTSKGLDPQPADGSTISETQPEIKANLKAFGKINPASLSVRISGIGPVKGKYDEATQTFTYSPARSLPESTYTVIITAGPQTKRQEGRWSFTIAPEHVAEKTKAQTQAPANTEAKPSLQPQNTPKTTPDPTMIGQDEE